jgi:glucosamine--fructose-6-phosphate aminotransferase (isomerizing)
VLGKTMEAEICEQAAALAANSGRYETELASILHGASFDLIVIAARGSSDHAALYARYLIEVFLGIPVCLAAPSVWTRYNARVRYPKSLCIGISQSGAAPDVAEVVEALRGEGHMTLGITNTEGSRLTQVAEHSVCLGVGLEKSLPATKTYSSSLLAMYQLVAALGGHIYGCSDALPDEAWLAKCHEAAKAAAPVVTSRSPMFSLGRGFGFATALEQALKLMECALVACKGYSIADFEHGPKALVDKRSGAIAFGPIPEMECAVVSCPETPAHVPEPLRPLWDACFAQFLALEAARIMGVDPDAPRNLNKVTRTL